MIGTVLDRRGNCYGLGRHVTAPFSTAATSTVGSPIRRHQSRHVGAVLPAGRNPLLWRIGMGRGPLSACRRIASDGHRGRRRFGCVPGRPALRIARRTSHLCVARAARSESIRLGTTGRAAAGTVSGTAGFGFSTSRLRSQRPSHAPCIGSGSQTPGDCRSAGMTRSTHCAALSMLAPVRDAVAAAVAMRSSHRKVVHPTVRGAR